MHSTALREVTGISPRTSEEPPATAARLFAMAISSAVDAIDWPVTFTRSVLSL